MNRPSRIIRSGVFAVAMAAAAVAPARGDAGSGDSVTHKLTIKSFFDFGHLVNGSNPYYTYEGEKTADISMLPLNRANVSVTQELDLNRFDVMVGLSGLIWWPYGNQGDVAARERILSVKPMIPTARARWQFGAPASFGGSIQIGAFNYKYNPDAKDLGEYLYRSGTYPGFLWTNDGWLLMNRAGNYSYGALFSLSQMGGLLKHNFSLFMETQYYPVGDFSPGYDFSVNTKWLEFGGGVVLNHYLSNHPSRLTPKNDDNTFVRVRIEQPDTAGGLDTVAYSGPKTLIPLTGPVVDTQEISHWTFKGIKLMGRAALNLGRLLPEGMSGTEDLRLFTEVAVLGWENQPLFYEKRNERMPMMAGITLPTFKWLDVLSLQVEYDKSPYNDIFVFTGSSVTGSARPSLPLWQATPETDTLGNNLYDPTGKLLFKAVHKDDFKWSVYAKKAVSKAITVYAQAASDHFRLTDAFFNASNVPLTASPKEWYYLFRLEFALR